MRLHKSRRPDPVRGAVSPELSAMLIRASQPTSSDVFLDPFAGTGAFIAARLQHPVSKAIYSDVKLQDHRKHFLRSLGSDKRVLLLDDDALELARVPDESVDAIVTDPPWGEYASVNRPYEEFGKKMAASFKRVLKNSGRFVVMVNRRNASTLVLTFNAAGLTVQAQHRILLNGHPATVFVGKSARYLHGTTSGLRELRW